MPKCRYCKNKFEARNSLDRFCSPDHAIAWLKTEDGQTAQLKARQKKEATERKEAKQQKRDYYRKQLGWQHKQTQPVFNRMRRLQELKWFQDRNVQPYCISCLKPFTSTDRAWHISHFKSVGSSPAIRYDENNTFLGCAVCNNHLSGNINGTANTIGYIAGLSHRFGQEEAERTLSYLEEHQSDQKKWTCDELEELRKGFNAEIRRLEKLLN